MFIDLSFAHIRAPAERNGFQHGKRASRLRSAGAED